MKCDKRLLTYSVVLGILITLISSFLTNSYIIGVFPDVQFVSIPVVGVAYYGHPFPWMRQVVYPGAEKEIIWYHLILDLIIWTLVILLIKKTYFKGKGSKTVKGIKSKAKKKLKKVSKKKPKKSSRKKSSKKKIKKSSRKKKSTKKKSSKKKTSKKSSKKKSKKSKK